jgi:imidazolonepropionase-like amidohydrolase
MILIKNAKILTMAGADIDCGDILIENDKIAAVGTNLSAPEGTEVIDATGLWALPGFIDAHCHLGMWEDGMGFEGADGNGMTDPVTPQMRAIDAINPIDPCFKEAREAGITTACTGPGSANVIGGQFVAVKTYGSRIDDMILKAPLAMKAALGENPKRVYDEQKKSPSTRMATAAIFREAMVAAQEYRRKQGGEHAPDRNLKMEILVDVLEGRLPLKIHAHRADDIITAIRLAKEFNLNYSVEHCTEGYMIAEILKQENVKVIVGPLLSERSKIELKNLTFDAPRILAEAGIKFAMMTDHPVIPLQYLPVEAALAVREGLDEHTALEAITINAAEITGLADRIGSLVAGKDADISLFNGNPLDFRVKPQRVFINGKQVYRVC